MKTLLTLLGIGIFPFTFDTYASDFHNYNGIACDFRDQPIVSSTQLVRDYYGVRLLGQYRAWVSCPVPVDSVGSLKGVENVEVIVSTERVSDRTRCEFTATNEKGEPTVLRKEFFGNGRFSMGNFSKDHGRYETYKLDCELPQRGILHSYLVNES